MRILFVCPYPLSPIKRRPLNFALHLAQRHEVHLRVLARDDEMRAYRRWPDSQARLAAACASVEILPVSLSRIVLGGAVAAIRGQPFRVAYTVAHGDYADTLNRQCAALRIDVAHVDRMRLAPLANLLEPPSIVDLPDCMSWQLEEWSAAAAGGRRLFFAAEAARLRRFEGGALNASKVVLAASAADGVKLAEAGYHGEVAVIPGIIDLQEDEDGIAPAAARPLLLFHGHLSYPPNVDAIVAFVRDVFGALRARYPSLRLAIVGVGPARAVRRLEAVEGVTVVADVPRMAPWLLAATAVIAPMRIGAGHSQKICEAMLMGRPVICSPGVAARLATGVREQLLLATHVEEWIEHVGELIAAPDRAQAAGEENRRVAQRHYGADAVLPKLEATYARASR